MNLKIDLARQIGNMCVYKVSYIAEPNRMALVTEVTPVHTESGITYNWSNDVLPEFVMDFFEAWYEA